MNVVKVTIIADAENAILPGLLFLGVTLVLAIWLLVKGGHCKTRKVLKMSVALVLSVLGIGGIVNVFHESSWPIDPTDIVALVFLSVIAGAGILTLKRLLTSK